MIQHLRLALALLVTSSPLLAHEQAKLFASDAAIFSEFSWSVSLSGDTALVGARLADVGLADTGAAYVFVRSGTTWSEQMQLSADDADQGDFFGNFVSIDGDTAIVGAPRDDDGGSGSGSAYVFVRSGTTWTQQAKLTASDADAEDRFGWSVTVRGDTAVVGAHRNDDAGLGSGSAYVFVRSGTSWSEEAKLTASDAAGGDAFGFSLTLFGDELVVGAPLADGVESDSGAAYVFSRAGSTWTEEIKLTASDAAESSQFGYSLALRGKLAVGARFDEGPGSAYVLQGSGAVWTEEVKLRPSDGAAEDQFGVSVAIEGNTVLVGAYLHDNGPTDSGTAYLFRRYGTTWIEQQRLEPQDPAQEDKYAWSVSMAGGTALIGGYLRDEQAQNAGAAYVFVDFDELGTRYCSPNLPNSTGESGLIVVSGSEFDADDDLKLTAIQLPTNANIGYFIMGTGMNSFVPPGAGSNLCVAPGLKRYLPPVNNTNQFPGGFNRVVGTDGNDHPVSASITPGSTWNFQAWHRDSVAGTSHFTDAVSVIFQ